MDPTDIVATELTKHVEALNLALRYGWAWPDMGWPELKKAEQLTPTAGIIAWTDASQTIGTVHGVYLDNPDTVPSPRPVQWRWSATGAGLVIIDASSPVWVLFTPQTPEWTSEAYATGQNYPADTVKYDATTGECYIAKTATATAAVSDTSKWRKLTVPWILRRAAVRGAVALLSGTDGKRGEEQILESSMDEMLTQEWKQFTRAAGQHQTINVRS
jgi:hypothetical protein